MPRIPFSDLNTMTREVRSAVDDAWASMLDRGDFVRGAAVELFEEEWAKYCGVGYAIGVGNGTDAIQLALRALTVGPGDEVIVPANTFVATVEAIVLAGAVPRFADVDPDTLLLDATHAAAAITPRTKAIIAVHLYGQMCDMDGLSHVATAAGLALIEDAAQAHGATWRGRPAGSWGNVATFSFYPGKNLGAFGDAGAVVTSDPGIARAVRALRDHGRVDGSHYVHTMLATNSRLDTIQAAVLAAKLPLLDGWNDRRRHVAAQYARCLAGSNVRLVATAPEATAVHHLLVARVPRRELVRTALAAQGIETGVHYPTPCHLLPPYLSYCIGRYPVAEEAARQLLSLPMHPFLSDDDVATVSVALRDLIGDRAEIGA